MEYSDKLDESTSQLYLIPREFINKFGISEKEIGVGTYANVYKTNKGYAVKINKCDNDYNNVAETNNRHKSKS